MARYSLFAIHIFMIKYVAYACSPIDSERLKREVERRPKDEAHGSAKRKYPIGYYDTSTTVDWSPLRRPRELIRLIKRQHMVGNTFIAFFVFQVLFMFHIFLKNIIYFSIGLEHGKLSAYYPPMAGLFPETYLFNHIFLIISAVVLALKLRNTAFLISNAIINSDYYKRLDVTQLNLGELTRINMSFSDWQNFSSFCRKHQREVQEDKQVAERHFHMTELNQGRLAQLSRFELIYCHDLINFEECWSHLQLFKLHMRPADYWSWHCSDLELRFGPGAMRILIFYAILSAGSLVSGLVYLGLGTIYLELRSTTERGASFLFVLTRWTALCYSPVHWWRLFDMGSFLMIAVAHSFEAFLLYLDAMVLSSRFLKIERMMTYEIKLCEEQTNKYRRLKFENFLKGSRKENMATLKLRLALEKGCRRLNQRISDCIQLLGLLCQEFRDLRQRHTPYLNLLIIGNGITMTYAASAFLGTNTLCEVAVLIMMVLYCVTPIAVVLFASAILERRLRDFVGLIGRFIVNEKRLLEPETIFMMLSGSAQIEHLEDRSILFIGLYAITPNSVGPFVAYLFTAILFIRRFLTGN